VLAVLTREAGYNAELRQWIGDAADVVEAPLTRTSYRDVEEVACDIDATGRAGAFAALVVTSVRARPYVAASVARLSEGARVYAVGPSTARMLQEEGVAATGGAPGRAADLAPLIAEGPVLYVGARERREELGAALEHKGVTFVPVVAYDTVAAEVDDGVAWLLARADVVVIGAPSAWNVARTYVSSSSWVVVPGATTAAAVKRDHAKVIEAWGAELGAVVASLDGA
jgi:uroporphyrinogen-III synthase